MVGIKNYLSKSSVLYYKIILEKSKHFSLSVWHSGGEGWGTPYVKGRGCLSENPKNTLKIPNLATQENTSVFQNTLKKILENIAHKM